MGVSMPVADKSATAPHVVPVAGLAEVVEVAGVARHLGFPAHIHPWRAPFGGLKAEDTRLLKEPRSTALRGSLRETGALASASTLDMLLKGSASRSGGRTTNGLRSGCQELEALAKLVCSFVLRLPGFAPRDDEVAIRHDRASLDNRSPR
jgi:hypothetical protein